MLIRKSVPIIILIALLACLSMSVNGQHLDWDLPTLSALHLKGKVATVRSTTYTAIIKNGEVVKGGLSFDKATGSPITDYAFNQAGKLVRLRVFDNDSSIKSQSYYVYNKNQVTMVNGSYRIWLDLDPDGKTMRKIESSGILSKYEYDAQGKRISEKTYRQDTIHPLWEFTYFYDGSGNLSEIRSLYNGKPNSPYAARKYTYDDHRNIVEERAYYPDNQLAYTDIFRYDDHGNIIEKTQQISDTGATEASANSGKNSLIRKWSYKYQYDQYGNWVRRTDFSDQSPLFITQRVIKYGILDEKIEFPHDESLNTDADSSKAANASETEAKFPGGIRSWQQFLVKSLKTDIPQKNGAPPGQYAVVVTFLINKEGKVTDAKCTSAPNPDYGAAAEAVRVINLSPDWIPAEKDGKKVVYKEKQKLIFRVEKEAPKQ